MSDRGRDRGAWTTAACVAILLVALAYFGARGIARALDGSGDFAVGYSAGRALILGHNPYDAAILQRDLLAADGSASAAGGLDELLDVYFPGTITMFAPLALVTWPAAKLLFLALNVVGLLFIGIGLGRLLGWRLTEPRALVLLAFVLALAPAHTTTSSGQTAILATAAIVGALLLERHGRRTASGALLGLATIVKIQVGLPFLAYLLWRRRWKAAVAGGLVFAASTLLAVLRMETTAPAWLSSWFGNLGALSGPGGMNDPSVLNPDRFSLIDLQSLLFQFVPPSGAVTVIALALVGCAALAFVALARDIDHDELLELSFVAVLTLLVTYHRYYDAVLLALPIAWAISRIGSTLTPYAAAVAILSADFLVPAQSALHDLEGRGVLPGWVVANPVWRFVLLVQHIWALVLLVIVLLLAIRRERRRPAVAATARGSTVATEL
jgi:hypothetical protein